VSDDIWAKEALIKDLNAVFDKHLAGGHRQWCRKYERPGEECSCGGDGLASFITKLRKDMEKNY